MMMTFDRLRPAIEHLCCARACCDDADANCCFYQLITLHGPLTSATMATESFSRLQACTHRIPHYSMNTCMPCNCNAKCKLEGYVSVSRRQVSRELV